MAQFNNTPTRRDDEAATAARLLDRHPDYKVLRRLDDAARLASPAPADVPTRIAAIVDVETTGFDPAGDRIIELAIQRIRFTDHGQISEVGLPRSWREDPGCALDPVITELTGLTDADLAGEAIDDAEATAMLVSEDVVIAHHAEFDSKFIEARLPGAAGLNWACSLAEVDWLQHQFSGRQLGHLLMQAGYFFEGHRAEQDVLALIHLLAHRSVNAGSVLAGLIARAEQPSTRIAAVGAPFAQKDILKARGYRWHVADRYWWTEVAETEVNAELLWLHRNGCDQGPSLSPRTWKDRHR
jgi:DNA polymerase-3 subunit epsilon